MPPTLCRSSKSTGGRNTRGHNTRKAPGRRTLFSPSCRIRCVPSGTGSRPVYRGSRTARSAIKRHYSRPSPHSLSAARPVRPEPFKTALSASHRRFPGNSLPRRHKNLESGERVGNALRKTRATASTIKLTILTHRLRQVSAASQQPRDRAPHRSTPPRGKWIPAVASLAPAFPDGVHLPLRD